MGGMGGMPGGMGGMFGGGFGEFSTKFPSNCTPSTEKYQTNFCVRKSLYKLKNPSRIFSENSRKVPGNFRLISDRWR